MEITTAGASAAPRWEGGHSCDPVASVSWPKIPSVPPDGYHERERECRRLFVVQNQLVKWQDHPVAGNLTPVLGSI